MKKYVSFFPRLVSSLVQRGTLLAFLVYLMRAYVNVEDRFICNIITNEQLDE